VKRHSTQSGFTLIELLVAIAVSLVFIGSTLFSRADFDSTVRLGSITREVALIARQAQTYGAGGGSGGSEINLGQPHGLHVSASSTQVTLYTEQDEPPNNHDGESDEVIEQFQLPSDYRINQVCVDDNINTENCSGVPSLNELNTYFVRPSLNANFLDGNDNTLSSQRAIIEVEHRESGDIRTVVVDTTGYITVPSP